MFFLLKMGVCFQKWESENGRQSFDSRWRLSTTVALEQCPRLCEAVDKMATVRIRVKR